MLMSSTLTSQSNQSVQMYENKVSCSAVLVQGYFKPDIVRTRFHIMEFELMQLYNPTCLPLPWFDRYLLKAQRICICVCICKHCPALIWPIFVKSSKDFVGWFKGLDSTICFVPFSMECLCHVQGHSMKYFRESVHPFLYEFLSKCMW